MLEKREAYLETKIQKELQTAKKMLKLIKEVLCWL